MADAALHVGVDGRELIGHRTGVGRYIREVLRVWAGASRFAQLTVFAHAAPDQSVTGQLGPGVTWQVVSPGRGGTWWEQWHLPRALRAAGVDVLFSGGYTAPLVSPCPFVVAIHDGSFWAHPEWFNPREGARRRFFARQAARRASHVVTISEFSAREIVRFTSITRRRITIATPGAPERPAARRDEGATPTAARGSDAANPLVLYVGSLFNRRHLPELIAGFAHATAVVPEARLVLVGDNRTRPHVDPVALADRAGVGDRVEWRAYVDDEALTALYRRARVFAFLSSYEGFAMTPLEALRHGVPAVLLDTEVAREVYNGAARFVTLDPSTIGDALADLLVNDASRRELVEAGQPLFERHSWTATAEAVACLLADAATRSRR